MEALKVIMGGVAESQTHTQTSGSLSERCSKCGHKLYMEIQFLGEKRVVRKQCKCEQEEYERNQREDENRQRQYRLDRLKQYSMMDAHFEQCRFENFVVDDHNGNLLRLANNYCEKWPEMKEQNMGFLFYGAPGTGKTFLAFCIANYLLEKMVPVIAISSIGILQRIKQTYSSYGKEAEVEIIQSLKNASLLVLDDIGAENDTNWTKEKLYEIIDSRYRDGKPMICTTNLTREQLKDKMTGEDGVTRTYDRLIEMCFPVEVTGPSKRAQAASKKAAIVKNLLR
jgi:DNA replication protein DnaC